MERLLAAFLGLFLERANRSIAVLIVGWKYDIIGSAFVLATGNQKSAVPIKREKHVTHVKEFYSMLFWPGTFVMLFSSYLWAADGIISKIPDASGTFCNLKFPAIKEETLPSDRPVLKDPSENDIIDFYGPCDHDPLGKEEVQRQKGDIQRERHRIFGDE
jgi:hypothetical protein